MALLSALKALFRMPSSVFVMPPSSLSTIRSAGVEVCWHDRLTTDDEGIAKNVFWITDRRGRKLSNFHAELLGERVADFVVYCTPDQKVSLHQPHWLQ